MRSPLAISNRRSICRRAPPTVACSSRTQRIDAELHVIDPGKAAVGFEIDACLRSESGAIGCANDVRRRATG